MPIAPLFAADLVDIIRALIPIAFLVFWVLSQVIGRGKGGKQAENRRVNVPNQPRPARAERPQAAGNESISAEIEAFLRGAGKPKENQEQADRVAQERIARRAQEKRAREAAKRESKRVEAARLAERSVQLTKAAPLASASPDAPRVIEHLHEPSIAHADEAMAARLSQTFGHQVGSLAARTSLPEESQDNPAASETAAKPTPTAVAIANLLSNPQNLQGAIILQEILSRPAHRW